MDRRKFVKITGVAAAAGATGCIGGGGNGDDSEDGENGGDGENGEDGENGGGGGAASTVGQDGNFADMTGQGEVEIDVGAGDQGFKFDPADVRIDPGTTVRWVWTGRGSQHNVVEADGTETVEDPAFESELTAEEGNEFTYTFEESGTHDYVCSVHLAQDMVGRVEVVEGEGDDGGMDGGMNETDDSMDGNETSGNESM